VVIITGNHLITKGIFPAICLWQFLTIGYFVQQTIEDFSQEN